MINIGARSKPSWSAHNVALARAHLTSMGIVDDGFAQDMLRPLWAFGSRLFGASPRSLGRNWLFAHLAARTLFFDDQVSRALEDGTSGGR